MAVLGTEKDSLNSFFDSKFHLKLVSLTTIVHHPFQLHSHLRHRAHRRQELEDQATDIVIGPDIKILPRSLTTYTYLDSLVNASILIQSTSLYETGLRAT